MSSLFDILTEGMLIYRRMAGGCFNGPWTASYQVIHVDKSEKVAIINELRNIPETIKIPADHINRDFSKSDIWKKVEL